MPKTDTLLTDLRTQAALIEALTHEIDDIAAKRNTTIQQLREAGLSLARIGEVAGLSYQRVQQITKQL